MMNKSITIVTAFFDIGRGKWQHNFKRSTEDYLSYFTHLATLDNEMIIFTSKEFVEVIKKIRGSKKTTIIELNFDQKFKYTIKKIDNVLQSPEYLSRIKIEYRNIPEYSSAEYVLITNLKYYFIQQAITKLNSSDDSLIAWVDFGYCRSQSKTYGIKNWYHNFNSNKIHLFSLQKNLKIENKEVMLQRALDTEVFVIGGIMVGSSKQWQKTYPLISSIQKFYLNRGITDDDQGTLLMTLCEYPELFQIHLLKKGWFGFFKQYNQGSTYISLFHKLRSLLKI